jgi:hypothetical protein
MLSLFPKSTNLFTINRLAAFDASDKARRVREEVLNSLEAFTYRARDLVEDESFIAVSTQNRGQSSRSCFVPLAIGSMRRAMTPLKKS